MYPLPLYHFSGQGRLPVPSSFSSKIPSIYTVPDLEAFALELVSVDTGEVAACVSETLIDGWSMQKAGATWTAVGVVLLSIVMSGLWRVSQARWIGPERGLWTEKGAWRVVGVASFIQSIAVSAMLNINYCEHLQPASCFPAGSSHAIFSRSISIPSILAQSSIHPSPQQSDPVTDCDRSPASTHRR
ncbi:flavin carrier protein 2 [Ceratobasidium sp. AG-Ba]|nr:flavin carrier protein 2 [Ceratobasidium sp. AG-Ba]